MSNEPWRSATWRGNRTAQHRAFMALSFREKLVEIERMAEVAAVFEAQRRAAGLPTRDGEGPYRDTGIPTRTGE